MAIDALGEAQRHGRAAAREAAPWVEKLARLGYAAKGVVYLIIGGIAARAAFGSGERVQGSQGALQTILEQPFGKFLLALVALGLAGYALWRFVQAGLDPEHGGRTDGGGAAKRVGYAISGVIHAGLALAAARMVMGRGGGGGDRTADWTATLMRQPAGRWLVAAVGLGIVGYGLYALYRAYAVKLDKRLNLSRMSPAARTWAVRSGRAGIAARGVVFAIMGFFLLRAALRSNPGEARGLDGALRALQQQAYGPWLLGLVALGLVGYGIYQLVEARYRSIQPA
ncbi:MAG TPA: DUF1206 domain-containing protein [Longimicrobiaceae bacterium]|jgi:hypothetical protein